MPNDIIERINGDNESNRLKRRAKANGRTVAFKRAMGEYSSNLAALQDLDRRNGLAYIREARAAAASEVDNINRRIKNCRNS